MNKTDRLLAIVLELQGKGRQRAEDLAATFETSRRTIYRDIQALCEVGVPLVSTPGYGYSLMEGYFLPPLSFSADEATMLLLGSDFMAQNFDAEYRAAAEAASRKIMGVLPDKQRAEVQYLQANLRFIVPASRSDPDGMVKLQHLRRAIIQRIRVRFGYQRRHDNGRADAATLREADPCGLVHIGTVWYLTAYCHLRQDVRAFRLDRIDNLTLLEQTFIRPAHFELQLKGLREHGELIVRVLFDVDVARWVRESPSFYMVAQEDTAEGLLVTLQVRQERDVLQWLLSWGRYTRVLEPASLQRMVAEEAEAIWNAHKDS